MFGGESFFLNHYEARENSELWLSSGLPGDMRVINLQGNKIVVQSGSFLACEDGLEMNVGWQGFKNFFSGESLFWLEFKGSGQLVISSFGAIFEKEVNGEFIIDSGHIVAFEETLSYELTKAGSSWLHSVMGGEGIVCRFKGQGKVWVQSHNPMNFGAELTSYLKPKQG